MLGFGGYLGYTILSIVWVLLQTTGYRKQILGEEMSYQLTAIVDTVIKYSDKQSQDVGGSHFEENATITTDTLKRMDRHYLIDENKYVYCNHVKRNKRPSASRFKATYHWQRSKKYKPLAACLRTSIATALDYLKLDPNPGDNKFLADEIFEKLSQKNLDVYTHDNLVRICKLYGAKDVFSTETSYEAIKEHLADGNPVVISGRFTRSGHVIFLYGYDDESQMFLGHDPYGRFPNYDSQPNGANVEYSYNTIYRVSYNGNNSCWAHLISR